MDINGAGKEAFEEAVVNMTVSSSEFYEDYIFYMHLLSKCRINYDQTLPACAGVSYHEDHYVLHLNPLEVFMKGKDPKGNTVEVLGFTKEMPLKQRIGVLKHEMSHIMNGHLLRVEDRDFQLYNFASDCALNQDIDRSHLPEYAIYPDTLFGQHKAVWGKTAEQYYDLLEESAIKIPCSGGGGEGDGGEGNQPLDPSKGMCVDDHAIWKKSTGDAELQKEITKKIVEDAGNETIKAKGKLPAEYGQIIDNLTIKRELDWKKLLRQIVGNKKAHIRKTLMRKDRRLPNFSWLKGRTKDRIFELAVISDVSGSMSDKALLEVWGEALNICDTYKVPITVVQVDTVAHEPQILTKDTKKLERKARGGTYLSPALDKLKESGVKYDALVVTTDGHLFNDDIEPFKNEKVPVIWVVESSGQLMPEMNSGRMSGVKLKESK